MVRLCFIMAKKSNRWRGMKSVKLSKVVKAEQKKENLKKSGKKNVKQCKESEIKKEPVKKGERKAVRRAELEMKQAHSLFSADKRSLLVGEGDLSFARSLCKVLGRGAGVVATNMLSEEAVTAKYPEFAKNRKVVEDDHGGTVLCGVDGTKLHRVAEFRRAFTKVAWNFPDLGNAEDDDEETIAKHRKMLGKFFRSAAQCLEPTSSSEIHVALKIGEPYKSWKIVQTARAACSVIDFRCIQPFTPEAWPGYSGVDAIEESKGANIYVFARRSGID